MTALTDSASGPLLCIECGRQYPRDKRACPADGGLLIAQDPLGFRNLVGKSFGDRYKMMDVLGEGGTSVVYKAHHMMMDRFVAIKILKNADPSSRMLYRFQQEARALSKLSHSNLLTIYDFGVTPEGRAYLVTDYIEGTSLDHIIAMGPMDPLRVARLFAEVCEGLEHAHSKGIVHRDIKPSNILLVGEREKEVPKIVDFGIAKLAPASENETINDTQAGGIFGSPRYMSPEQCADKAVDHRTDIYALGVTMYNALAGRPPFEGTTLSHVIYQQLQERPLRFSELEKGLDVPAAMESVVLRCMEKDPADRYQSLQDIKSELVAIAGSARKKTASKPSMLRVVLAEDNDEVAQTITHNIATAGGAFIVSRITNGAEAVEQVAKQPPNLLLVDVKIPVMDGMAVTKEVKARFPDVQVLLFSISDNVEQIVSALPADADGYLFRDLSPARLGTAIKAVAAGIPWIDPEITSRLLREPAHATVKDEELEVSTKPFRRGKLDHGEYMERLGAMYVTEKKYDEAESFFHSAIALAEKAWGQKSAQVASACTRLADLYMSNKNAAAAEQHYLRALEIRLKTLGIEHVDVATNLESLGLLFKVSGSLEQAERFFLSSMRIREKLCTDKDPSLAGVYLKISSVYVLMGRSEEAEEMDRKAKIIQENLLSQTTGM